MAQEDDPDIVPLTALPPELIEDACQRISNFSIGFVRPGLGTGEIAELGGSGTLVRVGGTYGVLTAAHVLAHLRESDTIGLLYAGTNQPLIQRATIPRYATRSVTLQTGCRAEDGPDLGLLVLADVDVGPLLARKSFYQLSADYVLPAPRALTEGLWFLCGFAGEGTTARGPERGFNQIVTFEGGIGRGWVETEYVTGEFDYLDFEAGYGGQNGPPTDFGGYSGAGLWQVPVKRNANRDLEVGSTILSGVAFYQEPRVGDRRIIKCHGRRSIYVGMVEEVGRALR